MSESQARVAQWVKDVLSKGAAFESRHIDDFGMVSTNRDSVALGLEVFRVAVAAASGYLSDGGAVSIAFPMQEAEALVKAPSDATHARRLLDQNEPPSIYVCPEGGVLESRFNDEWREETPWNLWLLDDVTERQVYVCHRSDLHGENGWPYTRTLWVYHSIRQRLHSDG